MKEYIKPEVELIEFESEAVTSTPGMEGGDKPVTSGSLGGEWT